MLQSDTLALERRYGLIGVRMEDPIILVTLLKIILFVVMLGAVTAIFREIILMAHGVVLRRPEQAKTEE